MGDVILRQVPTERWVFFKATRQGRGMHRLTCPTFYNDKRSCRDMCSLTLRSRRVLGIVLRLSQGNRRLTCCRCSSIASYTILRYAWETTENTELLPYSLCGTLCLLFPDAGCLVTGSESVFTANQTGSFRQLGSQTALVLFSFCPYP